MNTNYATAKVSIIIPTKNRCLLLTETIASIRQQSYENWEAIVVDDGSIDDTPKRIADLSKTEPRLKFVRRSGETTGAPVCRNQGAALATGDYTIFLDSDDCLASFCLSNRVRVMEKHPELDFGVFPCQLFNQQPGDVPLLWNTNTLENDLDRFLSLDAPWGTASPIWKKEALNRLRNWDESLLRWQDWDFHVRALIEGLNYQKFVEPPDCFWRMPTSRQTIASKGYTPEHIRSNEKVLIKTYQMLLQNQLLNEPRRRLLTGLYFILANRWIVAGARVEAIKIWSYCQQFIDNKQEYQEVLIYLKIEMPSLARKVAKKYLEIRYPNLKIRFSKTFKNTPIQPSQFEKQSTVYQESSHSTV